MIKLLIVDDERIIRETIAQLIDWKKLGIMLIGSAANGLEALNIILDESPDIVMTDIRMPGLSGLELIRQIRSLNHDTRFIILSGYEEFEYAKEAMKYGIRHYLLKPCNESQIIDAIQSLKLDIQKKALSIPDKKTNLSMMQGIIFNIISESFSESHYTFNRNNMDYSGFINFENTPYTLYYCYYLEHKYYQSVIHEIERNINHEYPELDLFYIYVENTLLFFHKTLESKVVSISSTLNEIIGKENTESILSIKNFSCLSDLLNEVLPKITRYETIYFKMFNSILPLSKCDSMITHVENLLNELFCNKANHLQIKTQIEQLQNLFSSIHSLSLLQQIGNITVTKILSDNESSSATEVSNISEFCHKFYHCQKLEHSKTLLDNLLNEMLFSFETEAQIAEANISQKIIDYVLGHLSNPGLSLKNISEQVLYMNPDYVSKRFIKETGEKFSQYLTRTRIDYAKKLLSTQPELSVQRIAQEIGYGNNPLYFSQLFKKHTKMPPSSYYKIKHTKNSSNNDNANK